MNNHSVIFFLNDQCSVYPLGVIAFDGAGLIIINASKANMPSTKIIWYKSLYARTYASCRIRLLMEESVLPLLYASRTTLLAISVYGINSAECIFSSCVISDVKIEAASVGPRTLGIWAYARTGITSAGREFATASVMTPKKTNALPTAKAINAGTKFTARQSCVMKVP